MFDLAFSYDNENGNRITMKYVFIFDFIEDMESDRVDIPMMDYQNVEADFFENPLQHKHFNSIADLYKHCNTIMDREGTLQTKGE